MCGLSLGGSRQNIAITLGTEKPEWCGYMMVKKFEDMSTRFDTIHERDRQQDGRTDGQTDTSRGRACAAEIGIFDQSRFIACCQRCDRQFLPDDAM